jgi:hypothetical protein
MNENLNFGLNFENEKNINIYDIFDKIKGSVFRHFQESPEEKQHRLNSEDIRNILADEDITVDDINRMANAIGKRFESEPIKLNTYLDGETGKTIWEFTIREPRDTTSQE